MFFVLLLDGVEEVLGPDTPALVGDGRLMDSFFARRTMFSIIAPEAKSLKYMISLSPFW